MRVGVLIVLTAVCFEHVWASIHGQPQVWDWQQVGLVVGSLGAKATQRAFEPKPDAAPKPADPPKP